MERRGGWVAMHQGVVWLATSGLRVQSPLAAKKLSFVWMNCRLGLILQAPLAAVRAANSFLQLQPKVANSFYKCGRWEKFYSCPLSSIILSLKLLVSLSLSLSLSLSAATCSPPPPSPWSSPSVDQWGLSLWAPPCVVNFACSLDLRPPSVVDLYSRAPASLCDQFLVLSLSTLTTEILPRMFMQSV